MQTKRSFDIWTLIALGMLALYLVFLVSPLFTLLVKSVVDQKTGEYSLAYFVKFFSHKYYYRPIFNSIKVSTAVSFLVVLFATPLAYLLRMYRIKGRDTIRMLLLVSCMQAPFIGGYSWILLLGRNGVITRFLSNTLGVRVPDIYGFPGMLLVFTLSMTPLMFIYLYGAMEKIDGALLEASELMGFVGIRKVVRIVLPLILPTVLAGVLVVFMRVFSDYATPMLIGEGYRTVPVLIVNEFIGELGGDSGFAAAISVSVILFATTIFLLQKYVSSRKSFVMSALNPVRPKQETGIKNVLAHLYVYLFTLLTLFPHIYVVYTAFRKTSGNVLLPGYSLDNFRSAFSRAAVPIRNTFTLGGIAIVVVVFLAVLLGYITVRKRNVVTSILDVITMFPYLVPGSIVGIALLLRFNAPPLLLSATAAIMVISYVIRRLPFTVRSSAAIMHQININTEEAAISLGASNLKSFFQITLPQMLPGVISGAILSWITIISEVSASVLLYTTRTQTMTIRIYTDVIRGNYPVAAALSTILYATTVISLIVFFRVSKTQEVSL